MTRAKLTVSVLSVVILVGLAFLLASILRERARIHVAESEAQLFRQCVEADQKSLADGGDTLHYYSTGNTDRLLAELRGHPGVERIGFEGSDVTAAGFRIVSEFPNLKELLVRPNYTPIDDRCLLQLTNHRGLKEIVLLQTAITDDGIAVLTTLPSLRKLRINNWNESNLSEESIDKLTALQQLEELILGGKWVTDDTLDRVRAAMPNTRVERDTQEW